MRKSVLLMLALFCFSGCQTGRPMQPQKYIFMDTTGAAKQVSMNSLDEEIISVEDLYAHADTVLIGCVVSVDEAENVDDERFRTPLTITCQEALKGTESSLIYMDGGRMGLERYREEGIDDLIMKSAADLFPPDRRKTLFFTIVPLNFVDLEKDKTYLFFVKDGMIVNGGYGVFEKQDADTYVNTITAELLSIQKLKEMEEEV